jgi:hypothetical protein
MAVVSGFERNFRVKKTPQPLPGAGFSDSSFGLKSLSEHPASRYENKNNEAKEYDYAVERRHGATRVESDGARLVPVFDSVLHFRG